jgi:hypothetical protein
MRRKGVTFQVAMARQIVNGVVDCAGRWRSRACAAFWYARFKNGRFLAYLLRTKIKKQG